MWNMWLVLILTSKHKSLKRVENFEMDVIFSCYYSLILLIIQFLFYCVHLLSRFILQTVLLSGYFSFSICSALNPDCSFVFEWRNVLVIWTDAQIFVLRSLPLFPYSSYYWRCDPTSYLQWAVMVKIINSCLCSPVVIQLILFYCSDWQGVKYCLVGRVNCPYYCLLD